MTCCNSAWTVGTLWSFQRSTDSGLHKSKKKPIINYLAQIQKSAVVPFSRNLFNCVAENLRPCSDCQPKSDFWHIPTVSWLIFDQQTLHGNLIQILFIQTRLQSGCTVHLFSHSMGTGCLNEVSWLDGVLDGHRKWQTSLSTFRNLHATSRHQRSKGWDAPTGHCFADCSKTSCCTVKHAVTAAWNIVMSISLVHC